MVSICWKLKFLLGNMMQCADNTVATCFSSCYFREEKEREKREAKAKAVCSSCPVKLECLEEAKEIAEPFGIWGGLNEVEEREI